MSNMASKSTHSLLDFSENRPLEAIGKSNSSNSLTGESSSAARVKMNGLFVGGVRGMSGKLVSIFPTLPLHVHAYLVIF